MALENPAWLNYLSEVKRQPKTPTSTYMPTSSILTPAEESARLAANPDLAKQVSRLEVDKQKAKILGIDVTPALGALQAVAGSTPAQVAFKALSVPAAGFKQLLNAVNTASQSDYNPLNWLADRVDEAAYGKVRTQAEREAAINANLAATPVSKTISEGIGKVTTALNIPTEAKYEAPSFAKFREDVSAMRGFGGLIPELQLSENAGILEKAVKLPAAFIGDVQSTGGARGILRFGSSLSRKEVGKGLGDFAAESFTKNAARLADETEEAFLDRAKLFAAKVTAANLKSRSAGVAKTFEEEFGKDAGKAAFKELPTNVKGGLGVGFGDAQFANINAGGYVTSAVAKKLGLDTLLPAALNPVIAYQSLKNYARTNMFAKVLDNIGVESKAWSNFVAAATKNASDADLLYSYKTFRTPAAYDPGGRMAEILGEEVLPSKQFITDLQILKKEQPELAARTQKYIYDPSSVPAEAARDEIDNMAMQNALQWRDLFDRMQRRMLDEGIPAGYLNDYMPVIWDKKAMEKAGINIEDIFTDSVEKKLGFSVKGGAREELTKAGLVNAPGKGYDPKKDRNIFTEEITLDNGATATRSSTLKEMHDKLKEAGVPDSQLKFLKTDATEVLADYTVRASKVIARQKLVNELYKAGLLFRGATPNIALRPGMVEDLIKSMTPEQLDRLTTDFMRDPVKLDTYVSGLNDTLAKAYDSADPLTIQAADDKLKETINALDKLGDVYLERVMGDKQLKQYQRLLKARDEAIDMEDGKALKSIQSQIDTMRSDATRLVKETPKSRQSTIETNLERKAYKDYIAEVLNVKASNSAAEIKRRYVLSDITKLDQSFIDGVARIPDELAGTLGGTKLMETLGKWISFNAKHSMAPSDEFDWLKTLNAATQGFRTQATFGRGPGFVIRNGIGAIFNNWLAAGVGAADYELTHKMWWTRYTTDIALDPLANKTGDEATQYVSKLVKNGKMNQELADVAKGDILSHGKVLESTLAKMKVSVNQDRLSKFEIPGGGTLADAYETSLEGGVLDPYKSVAGFSGMQREENLASMIATDPNFISIRNDRKRINAPVVTVGGEKANISFKQPGLTLKRTEEEQRSIPQRVTEAVSNIGVDAKVGDHTFTLRPIQAVAGMNAHMEEYHRNAAIIAGLRQYGNSTAGRTAAVANMRAAQFDYSNLTEAERRTGRLILPFYTWTRYNLPLQIRILSSQPQSYKTILDGWDTVQDIMGDENGDMYFIPSYLREAYGFAVAPEIQKKLAPVMVALGADPNDPIIARLESPILDINKFFTTQGAFGLPGVDVSQFTSGTNPIVKGIIQYVAKKNLYSGKTYNDKGVDAPDWYVNLSSIIGKAVPSAKPIMDPETGKLKVDERWLDFFKTTIPTFTTVDRTIAPAIDAAFSAIGVDTNFSASGDKLFTSIASSGLGLPVSTLTPEAEAGEVASQYRDMESKITRNQGRIDEYKLRTFIKDAKDAGSSDEEITQLGKFLMEQGAFNYVSAP